ncbi:MAG TPA: hypothetical protein VGZ22_00600 [Isosphaeraceae bacterium]|jgi:hypothetical protein|nr:hypothetical protein [Isosphaeraceae bacterium]
MSDPPQNVGPENRRFCLPVLDSQGITIGTVDLGDILGELGARNEALSVARTELADAKRQIDSMVTHMERLGQLLEKLSDEMRGMRGGQ